MADLYFSGIMKHELERETLAIDFKLFDRANGGKLTMRSGGGKYEHGEDSL
jgi:hypothetical protein